MGILKKQCVVAAQCDFTKERGFAMWICNKDSWMCDKDNLEIITGPLKDLLVIAVKLTMGDLEKMLKSAMKKQKNNNKIKFKKLRYTNDAFASLSLHEKISAIHFVADNLFDTKKEAPELELWMDATVDVLFSRIESHILEFVDDQDNEIKKSTINSYKQYFPKERMEEEIGGFEYDEDRAYEVDAHKIEKKEFWREIIESLRDVILFDRDFEMFETLEGLDLKVRDKICGDFGINLDRRLPKELLEEKEVHNKILQVLAM